MIEQINQFMKRVKIEFLRGYKIQFESRDGRYDCVDMDITKTDKESGVRPVNINTIKYLIFDGVKYVVE